MIGMGFVFFSLVIHLIGCAKKKQEKIPGYQKTNGGFPSPTGKRTPKNSPTASSISQATVPEIKPKAEEKANSCVVLLDEKLNTALESSHIHIVSKQVSDAQITPLTTVSVVEVDSATADKYKESMNVPIGIDKVIGEFVNLKKSKYLFPDTPSATGITNSKIEQSTIKISYPNQKIYRASSPPFGLSPINSATKSAHSSPGQIKANAISPNHAKVAIDKSSIRKPIVICNGPK